MGLKSEQEDFENHYLVSLYNYVLNFEGNSKLQFKLVKKTIRKIRQIETSLINPDTITKLKYVLYKKKEQWFIVNVVARGVSDLSKASRLYAFPQIKYLGKSCKKTSWTDQEKPLKICTFHLFCLCSSLFSAN